MTRSSLSVVISSPWMDAIVKQKSPTKPLLARRGLLPLLATDAKSIGDEKLSMCSGIKGIVSHDDDRVRSITSNHVNSAVMCYKTTSVRMA